MTIPRISSSSTPNTRSEVYPDSNDRPSLDVFIPPASISRQSDTRRRVYTLAQVLCRNKYASGVLSDLDINEVRNLVRPIDSGRWQRFKESNDLDEVGLLLRRSKTILEKIGQGEYFEKTIQHGVVRKADLEQTGKYQKTALMVAISNRNRGVSKDLIRLMTPQQLLRTNQEGQSALMLACRAGDKEIVLELLRKIPAEHLGAQNNNGSTALSQVIQYGKFEIAYELITRMSREQLSTQDRFGNTALMYACSKGCVRIAKDLIRQMTPEQISLKSNAIESAYSLAANYREIRRAILEKPGFQNLFMMGVSKSKMVLPKQQVIPDLTANAKEQIYGPQKHRSLREFILAHSRFLDGDEREAMGQILQRVEDEAVVTGAPQDPIQRKVFYQSMRKNLEHVAIKITDPAISEELKKTAMYELTQKPDFCATLHFQAALLARKLLCESEPMADSDELPEFHVEKLLYEYRVSVVDKIVRDSLRVTGYDVHAYNGVLATIGQETGTFDAGTGYQGDPFFAGSVKSEVLRKFKNLYGHAEIIELVRAAIRTDRIPSGVLSELVRKYILHGLSEQEQEKISKLIYQDPDSYNYTPTDLLVPYLLLSMEILEPRDPSSHQIVKNENLGLSLSNAPDFMRWVALEKQWRNVPRYFSQPDAPLSLAFYNQASAFLAESRDKTAKALESPEFTNQIGRQLTGGQARRILDVMVEYVAEGESEEADDQALLALLNP
ncbi:MAG: ankyrin repeat domain-containing protein [Deltaproteobacteria bacterium]|nr:ankyrin repeat domain-containing protein [Deltaproteobacteria bacterium]